MTKAQKTITVLLSLIIYVMLMMGFYTCSVQISNAGVGMNDLDYNTMMVKDKLDISESNAKTIANDLAKGGATRLTSIQVESESSPGIGGQRDNAHIFTMYDDSGQESFGIYDIHEELVSLVVHGKPIVDPPVM
jgi:hypothetical protein